MSSGTNAAVGTPAARMCAWSPGAHICIQRKDVGGTSACAQLINSARTCSSVSTATLSTAAVSCRVGSGPSRHESSGCSSSGSCYGRRRRHADRRAAVGGGSRPAPRRHENDRTPRRHDRDEGPRGDLGRWQGLQVQAGRQCGERRGDRRSPNRTEGVEAEGQRRGLRSRPGAEELGPCPDPADVEAEEPDAADVGSGASSRAAHCACCRTAALKAWGRPAASM